MAKKKSYVTSAAISAYEPLARPDNNKSSGLLDVPDHSTDPSAGNYTKGRFDFAGLVAKGEAINAPDVIVETANGCQYSKGADRGRQYNWGPGNAGDWNDNDFHGGNLTGN